MLRRIYLVRILVDLNIVIDYYFQVPLSIFKLIQLVGQL